MTAFDFMVAAFYSLVGVVCLLLLSFAGNKLQRLRLCESCPFQGGEAGIKRACFAFAVRLIRGGLRLFGVGGLFRLFLRLFAARV